MIGVGALGGDWRGRATFSNFGSWVDVYAPGRDLINAYATGTYTCHVYPYDGARQEVLRHGEVERHVVLDADRFTGSSPPGCPAPARAPRQAAAAVLAEARSQAIPGVGPVLWPGGYPHPMMPPA